MHDYTAPGWRQTIDRHYAALAEDLTSQLDAEVASAVAAERERGITETSRAVAEEGVRATNEAAGAAAGAAANAANEARRRLAESLNQTLRRIRQTTAEHETLQLLLEESALSAERVVVLLIESNHARIASWRGAALRGDEEEAAGIDLSEAAAIASCVESRDPLVVLATAAEISPMLAKALDASGSGKVYLFPITARLNTVALMLACGEVAPAPIELLCEAAGMKLESFEAQDVPPADLPRLLMSLWFRLLLLLMAACHGRRQDRLPHKNRNGLR